MIGYKTHNGTNSLVAVDSSRQGVWSVSMWASADYTISLDGSTTVYCPANQWSHIGPVKVSTLQANLTTAKDLYIIYNAP